MLFSREEDDYGGFLQGLSKGCDLILSNTQNKDGLPSTQDEPSSDFDIGYSPLCPDVVNVNVNPFKPSILTASLRIL
jgi:hypothetical protein